MKKLILTVCIALLSLDVSASSDVGTITKVYTAHDGRIAIKITDGYTDAIVKNECTTSNGWAGTKPEDDPKLKSTLLAAFASKARVTVIISGCTGSWYRLSAVYVD